MKVKDQNYFVDEKIFDEAIKELYYSSLCGQGILEHGFDSEEVRQANSEFEKLLNESIKDKRSLNDLDDVKGTLLLVTEAQGFLYGFKTASILSNRKSAIPDLNEKLSKEGQEGVCI